MDSFTHIVLGACIGELVAGKQLGKKAMLIGAIANSFPDIDIVASLWMPLTADLLAHRGITHSFFFVFLAAPLLSFISRKVFPGNNMSFGKWTFFWILQMFVHIFIDAFNAYGTGWFEPFSHYRVSFNSMFVADPLFTIWPSIAAIALLLLRTDNAKRAGWAKGALAFSSIYLVAGVVYKGRIDKYTKNELESRGVTIDQYFSTPTPLNNMLWYTVAQADSGFYIGYRSILDKNKKTRFHFVCRNNQLLDAVTDKGDIDRLKRFSQGFYTAELWHDTLVFNDLRFGEIAGWEDSLPRCIFYYYPQLPGANELVVQRGRFAKWDGDRIRSFLRRIGGN